MSFIITYCIIHLSSVSTKYGEDILPYAACQALPDILVLKVKVGALPPDSLKIIIPDLPTTEVSKVLKVTVYVVVCETVYLISVWYSIKIYFFTKLLLELLKL